MERRWHFISGLPRAGSTLTAAILRQNPRFHAGMSSPVASLFDGVIAQVSAGTELSTMVNEEQRARILRGLFDCYYADLEQPVIFDTNRAWTAKLPALMRLFPDAKVICCVRDVAWVMDSLERQYRNNAFEHTRLFNNPAERSTVYTRVEALAHANRLVGFAWHATARGLLLRIRRARADPRIRPARHPARPTCSSWSTSSSAKSRSSTISPRSNTTRRRSTPSSGSTGCTACARR